MFSQGVLCLHAYVLTQCVQCVQCTCVIRWCAGRCVGVKDLGVSGVPHWTVSGRTLHGAVGVQTFIQVFTEFFDGAGGSGTSKSRKEKSGK